MAALTDVQTVNITVNGTALVVPKGELIVESLKRMGLDVPIFCYHPRMKPVGMCRMCLIEMGSKGPDGSIRMMPKPQTACSLPATEGLVIVTDSDRIRNDRRGVLEFLLINHPLDCPICDRGGECPLQNNTLFYGPSTSRFIESKRHAPKAFPLSQYVTLDLERCIQCGRCVRFTEEISGDAQLAFRFRGASMQPSTFELRDFSSKFSGNVIEICPVGALTNTNYRFRARPWDLETKPAICTNCGNGCSIFIDHREDTLVRVNGRTNDDINEEWTCDRGKFGHGYYNSSRRLNKVLAREGVRLVPSAWPEAFTQIRKAFGTGESAALIGGANNSNEDLFALSQLVQNHFGSAKVSLFAAFDVPRAQRAPASPTKIRQFEHKKRILLFGTDLSEEQPILYLRVRKAWLNSGTQVVVAYHRDTDADAFANVVLRYREGSERILAAALQLELETSGSLHPMLHEQTGISVDQLRDAAEVLRSPELAVVATHAIFRSSEPERTVQSLRTIAENANASFDCYPLVSNGAGALLFGTELLSRAWATTREILDACIEGRIKSLWVVGEDLLDYPDQALVQSALEAVEFLVVQDVMETELTAFASLVLPMTAPAESEGCWTNIEQTVQQMKPALKPKGAAKPMWMIATELSMRIVPALLPLSAREIGLALTRRVPALAPVEPSPLLPAPMPAEMAQPV